jgi:tripartite-type tricarboxylate transporter receptor subunit TctC
MNAFACALFAVLASVGSANAQSSYPTKPVRILVGFPPGGIADVLARTVAQKMSESLPQPAIVENRPGAAGSIAAGIVAGSPSDGYTLLITAPASQAVVTALSNSLTYDAERDFAPVGKVAELPLVLAVHPSVPAKDVKELIALARSRPGQLTYGSAGNGSFQHLAAELFSRRVGIKIVHVPYKGSAQLLPDLVAGRISMSIDNPATVLPRARNGELRALAVTSPDPWPSAPDVPTLADAAGLPGFAVLINYGLVVPAATPPAVITVLNSALVRALKEKEVQDRLLAQGARASPSSPAEFGKLMRDETLKWTQVVKDVGISAN